MGNTDWHKINLKLYPVLLEKSLKELGLPTNSYSLLGGGSNGQAYLSNGRVYKITTDKSEAIESDKLIGKNNSRIANIFDVKRINTTLTNVEVFLVVLEHLNTKRQPIFEEIQTELIRLFEDEFNIHPFDVIYFYRFNPTIYKNEYEEDVYRLLDSHQREKYYYNSLLQIIDELKSNNIQSLDIQYHNLGIKPNGNLAYYDIGSGDIYGNVRGSIDISEDAIIERVMTFMKNSSAVKVKKNCQLAGKGNTSDACNQGDISNITLKPISENEYIDWDKNYNKSFRLVYTPKNATDNYEDGLLSVVTPENGSSWNEWKQVDQNTLNAWRKNWNNIQKTLAPHKYQQILKHLIRENFKPISENNDLEYKKWKRDNVTYRGISDTSVDGDNGGMAMLGQGLYSVPASNKSMARKYGTLAMLVNAKPKNPKVFNTLNDWEIWFQQNVVFPISKAKGKKYPDGRDVNSITDEMLKLGYDGIIIKGREIVNYKPENVRYYYNERQLENHYDDYVAPNKINDDLEYSHISHGSANQDKYKIGSLVEFELENFVREGIHAYHGTPNKFDQFSIDKIGSSDGREVGGWGIYFTDDIGIANDYRTGDGTVMEVELRNGKYFNFDEGLDDDIANDIVNRGLGKGLSEQDIEQFQSDFMDEQYRYDITNKQVYEWLSAVLGDNKAASMYLSSAGYIGNKFSDKTNPNATNYVIFDPNNIKIVSNGEELDEEDQVQQTNGFDLKTFDSLRSFAARKKYADSKLQKIGAGSSRIVYLMPDGKNVLKLASNVKGLAQNNSECGLGQDNYFGSILAKVSDCHNDDQWIVSELAKKVSPSRFTQLTGVDIKNLNMYLINFQEENKGRNARAIFSIDPTVKEQMNENPFVQQLTEMMQSYDLEAGDLGRLASYGEVNRDGQPDIVVSDYGLTKDVYKTHYDKPDRRRMYENYFDMNEEVKVEINDLPFKADVEQAGGKIYSVGGAVRDKLLGKESKDLDLLITGLPLDQLEEILKKYGRVDNVGKSFGIIKFNTPQTGELDIAIPRTERKNDAGGYQGFDVTSDHTLPIEKDLERRDFTINAIAKDSSGLMIDPYGGQGDIEKKQIKMVNPQAFSDDPLRMLRAVQFAARFNFEIEPETMKAIQQNASKIKEISPERILIEFDKIVKKGNPTVGAKLLRQTGLYENIFGTNKGINLAGFDKVKTMGEFIYKLLKSNVQSPSEFYKNKLKGDLESFNEIKALEIGGQYRLDELFNPYKRIFDMYKVYPKSIQTEIFGDLVPRLASEMKSKNIPFSLKEVPVNGNDLMELGYTGKQIGEVFVHLLNKIYTEQLPNEREAILNYLKSSK